MLEKGGQRTTLRGNDLEGFQSRSEQAIDYLDKGDLLPARKIVMDELYFLARHFNNYAWVLRETDPDLRQTLLLAETAVALEPQNSQYLHTLAEIQFKTGRKQAAITTLKKAGDIDPSYNKQLRQWQSEISGN
jgi:tetratricopeptide (TPR) repeat protein